MDSHTDNLRIVQAGEVVAGYARPRATAVIVSYQAEAW